MSDRSADVPTDPLRRRRSGAIIFSLMKPPISSSSASLEENMISWRPSSRKTEAEVGLLH